MFWLPTVYGEGEVNLQATLSSGTADTSLAGEVKGPHHPITCSTGDLFFDDDNTMRCDHSSAPANNPRNQAILDASISILIFQEVAKRFG